MGGVRLHYVEAGAGPPVVLLHGFPEHWYTWRRQIPALADAGFRVVAPDMRGYNLSDKPREVAAYGQELLVADVVGLLGACAAPRATVVGHDWGGVVAWHLAMRHPALVERLVVLNGPHPAAFARAIRTPRQMRKSLYALAFQLPALPEAVIRAGDFRLLRRMWRTDPARPDAYPEDAIERLVEAVAREGALTAMLNWYRAAFRERGRAFAERRVEQPVLVIWGDRDRYLGFETADPGRESAPDLRIHRLTEASHWVHADEPETVNRLIVEFATRSRR